MSTATSGASDPTSGRRGVTFVDQPLTTDSVTHTAERMFAIRNGQASHGIAVLRCLNNHGA